MAYMTILENVLTAWATALSETDIGARAYLERPSGTIQFPCASLLPLPSGERGYDLSNLPSGIELYVQVDVFVSAQTPLSKLFALNAVSHEAMCEMGFRLTAQASPEMPQSGYKRLISRYARVIGYSDPISTED